ncbi:MAG: SDR family oxidoreductase [Desulfobacteraceae bacterium]|nr:SDR family oxidoreductase [Desulfobacteraceae bacterium]
MLKNKKVVVVGGSSGIGLAVARLAQQQGARVVIASRQAPARVSESPSVKIMEVHSFNILADEDHSRLFEATGEIDHLVVTVRPEITLASFRDSQITEAKRAFDTKFWGAYRLIQAARPHFRDEGSITLTSGIAGERIYRGASTMAIINSATETLCRALAVELAPLRVNAVSPGFVAPKPRAVEEHAGTFPSGRLASLDEVASAYLSLMGNPYVTGTVLVVDGGARLV